MIDLTPLEVRKKKGDFRRAMRGYDPALVDDFLDLVADRMDELVRQNLSLSERVAREEQQVGEYKERERALTDALVTAQEMREEVRRQTAQEADLARRTAEQEIARLRSTAEREASELRAAAEQEASQLRAAAQQETTQLRARVQQEVSELRTTLRQEREREEEALRVVRARQQQFVTTYRAFLEEELNELGGITRALGLVTGPVAKGGGPPAAGPAEAPSGPGPGAGAGAAAGLAAGLIAGLTGKAGDAGAPSSPAAEQDTEPAGDESAGGDDFVLAVTEFEEEILLEAFEPEPFEPEPFEPDDFDADPVEPVGLEPGQPDGMDADSPDVTHASATDEIPLPTFADEEDYPVSEPFALADEGGDDADDVGLSPNQVADEAAGFAGSGEHGAAGQEALDLYDLLGAGAEEGGVPGPIGLGAGTWPETPTWHVDGVDLAPEAMATPDDSKDAGAFGEESGEDGPVTPAPFEDEGVVEAEYEDVDQLLRNAAAAGYSLEDLDEEELLLEDAVDDADEQGQDGDGDGWLPDLLEDER